MATNKIQYTEGSGLDIATHSFDEDAVTKHVERIAFGTGVATLPDTAQVAEVNSAATNPANPIDCIGKGFICIKSNFSANNVEVPIKLQFFDSADVLIGESNQIDILNTALADSARYLGTFTEIFNRSGFAGMKIRTLTAPTNSGNVSFYVYFI
jgi:hypothetical protein